MSTVKKQHVVPQFYLKHFSMGNDQVCVYDKITKKKFVANVKEVANERYFYDFDGVDDPVIKQLIEKSFSEFEAMVAPALNSLISRVEDKKFKGFSTEERLLFAEFIYYQMIRTKESRQIFSDTTDLLKKQFLDLIQDDKQRQLFEAFVEGTDAKDDQLRMILDRNHVEQAIRELASRIWLLADNQTRFPFYTSDHPVVGYTHWNISHLAYELFFPIGPKYGIWILNRLAFREFEILDNHRYPIEDREYSKFYNSLQVLKSNRQIICNSLAFELAEKIIWENPDASDPNRPRMQKLF
jgi:hypothetical protein